MVNVIKWRIINIICGFIGYKLIFLLNYINVKDFLNLLK